MGSARSFVIITMTAFTALFILFTWSVETTSEVETGLQVLEMNDTERLHRALLLQPRTHSWTISARPILLMALLLTVIAAVVMSNGGAEAHVSARRRLLDNWCCKETYTYLDEDDNEISAAVYASKYGEPLVEQSGECDTSDRDARGNASRGFAGRGKQLANMFKP